MQTPGCRGHQHEQVNDREHEILGLVAAGLNNTEIAASLHLSVATIKTHVSRLLSKLNARDRVQLVVIAYDSGVASPAARLAGRPGMASRR